MRVEGKFFFTGTTSSSSGASLTDPSRPAPTGPISDAGTGASGFRPEVEAGANTLRCFTVPPVWLLDIAAAHGLRVLAGIPWSQHITFLANEEIKAEIRQMLMTGVRSMARHKAVLAYVHRHEIPPDMIRWHGADKVRVFLKSLVAEIKAYDPGCLVSYANFPRPST